MNDGIIQVIKGLFKSDDESIDDDEMLKVRVSSEIRLDRSLGIYGVEDPASVTKLTIVGMMTRHDFKYIRKKMSANLQELDISGVTIDNNRIPNKAFDHCSNLKSIAIPNTILEIRKKTFSFCNSLTSISIPSSVLKIEELAFYRCTSLTSITIPESVNEIKFRAFSDCTALTSITIPNSVINIGSAAFGNCTNLTSVTLPDSEIEIGNFAFYNCTSLTSIYIPKNVILIGEGVFENCPAYITVDPENPYYSSECGKLI